MYRSAVERAGSAGAVAFIDGLVGLIVIHDKLDEVIGGTACQGGPVNDRGIRVGDCLEGVEVRNHRYIGIGISQQVEGDLLGSVILGNEIERVRPIRPGGIEIQ